MWDPSGIIAQARKALEIRDLRESWRQLDLVRSNFPELSEITNGLGRMVIQASLEQDRWGRVSIATWPGEASAAVCLTFDDRLTSHIDVVRPDLDSFGFLGTFFVIRDNPPLEPNGKWYRGWCSLAESQHELGNHTATHPKGLPELQAAMIEQECESCNRFIRQLGQDAVTSFAYPFGDHGRADGPLSRVVCQRFALGRATHQSEIGPNAATPGNMHRLQSLSVSRKCSLERLQSHLDRAIASRGWSILTFHKVATGSGALGIERDHWIGCLNCLATRAETFWIGTASQGAAYVYTRRSAKVNCHQATEDALFLSLKSDDLPVPTLVKPPLTATIEVPKSWKSARVTDDRARFSDHHVTQNRVRTTLSADGRLYRITQLS